MPSVTVTDLIKRVRFGLDMDDDQWVDDVEILRELNVVRPRLDAMIARAGGGLYERVSLTTPSTVEEFVLDPSGIAPDIMAVVGVWVDGGTGDYVQLHRLDPNVIYESNFWLTPGDLRGYYIQLESNGDINIVLRPPVSTGSTIVVMFVPEPLTMVESGQVAGESISTLRYPEGWEEWMVLEVQRVLDTREETINALREQRKTEIEKEIERFASDRLWAQGPRVRDVRAVEPGINSPFIGLDPSNWYWL